jgi:glucose-1-phosphate thymidylyltransferase
MRGVILAGGFGTRLRPFTLRLNKGMAPIYTPKGAIPQLLFPLRTLTDAGIEDILIVTSREHCGHIVELLGDGEDYNCNLTYKIQEMDRPVVGIAQALGLAKNFVGDQNFAVILGDNFYEDNFSKSFKEFDNGTDRRAAVFLKEVHDPERFGVASLNNNEVTKIVEKPKVPESNYAVTGLYLYTPHVFDLVPQLKPSNRGELEITDINNYYVHDESMTAVKLIGFWHDMGLPESSKRVTDFLWERDG